MKNKEIYKKLLSYDPIDIGSLFYNKTKIKFFKLKKNKIPRTWKRIYFKIYPRFKQIKLKVNNNSFEIDSLLINRKSLRIFTKRKITFKELSNFLFFSAGINNKKTININESRRMYPSAGARYPLEIYLINLKKIGNNNEGIYHYNVKWNTIELLKEENCKKILSKVIPNQKWISDADTVLIITAVFNRTNIKYKDRGWRYIYIEAGHLGQNFYLNAEKLKLRCCAIGGFDDNIVTDLLRLDNENEVPIYAFVLGK
ncbi:MAG: hypothetical protein PWQ56_485 [Patescibacteria group bacterium]|nr:hypothetical protein [Patescibacteria group bacterium]